MTEFAMASTYCSNKSVPNGFIDASIKIIRYVSSATASLISLPISTLSASSFANVITPTILLPASASFARSVLIVDLKSFFDT